MNVLTRRSPYSAGWAWKESVRPFFPSVDSRARVILPEGGSVMTPRIGNRRSTAFRFDGRHVLHAKLRPYLNKVATPGFARSCLTESKMPWDYIGGRKPFKGSGL